MLYTDGIARDRISVVHDGIDVDRIGRIAPTSVHQEFWLPHGVPVLVNIGALVDHKGQRYLLDALPLAMRRIPDLHLVILGEGELRRPLEQQVQRLHLERAVRMPGFRSDVLALARSADLFVMSSVTEGLGSTVLDAMAMGLAVVGTRAGGIPEAVVDGETGLLVPVADPPALADAIVSLMNDPARRARFGDAGRQRVARHFTVDHLVERTFAVYQEVVSRAARVTPRG
jgi:glycosyltransferase involved in cell wall biosynthesis